MTKEQANYIAIYLAEEIARKLDQVPFLEEILTGEMVLNAIDAWEGGAR